MGMVAFDTHAYVKRLTGAGMPEPQAEVLATEQTRLIENELATKRDIKALEVELKRDVREIEAALKHDIKALEESTRRDLKDLEYRLTIRLGLMLAMAVGLLATLDKLL